MIILIEGDLLQVDVANAGAVAIDVHASWLDNTAGAVSVGRADTAIETVGLTDIVASPITDTQRNVRSLYLRNVGTTDNIITVMHWDGSRSVELYAASLAAGAQLQYNDGRGFTA